MEIYECDHCGACCRGTLLVEAYEIDALREPLLLTADLSDFRATKSPEEIRESLMDEGMCLLIAGARPCRFLTAENRCSIYPTRPNACVGMQAGDEQCQSARAQLGIALLAPVAADVE